MVASRTNFCQNIKIGSKINELEIYVENNEKTITEIQKKPKAQAVVLLQTPAATERPLKTEVTLCTRIY